jgi:RimJ/RimL family protein N-acetyltransferase
MGSVALREVRESDLPIFFEHQRDPAANQMAAFPARDAEAFAQHWSKRMVGTSGVVVRTVVVGEQVAGNVVSWEQSGMRLIGYWIGREFWGKGVATKALVEFLAILRARPLHAYVAKHHKSSIRVLEKCGFTLCGQGMVFSEVHGREIEDSLWVLT